MSEDKESFYPEYDGLTLAELAKRQVEVKQEIDGFKAQASIKQKEFDHLRLHRIPEMMESMDIDNVKLTDIGRVSIRNELYASIITDHKIEAYDWLVENGHGALIKGTVNASSLKALIKEQIKEGEQFPDDLFKITPFQMATITKG